MREPIKVGDLVRVVQNHECDSTKGLGYHFVVERTERHKGGKMKALLLIVVIVLTGCGAADRGIASLTGFARSCIDGVLYYQFTSGVTVAYSPDGKIRTCK